MMVLNFSRLWSCSCENEMNVWVHLNIRGSICNQWTLISSLGLWVFNEMPRGFGVDGIQHVLILEKTKTKCIALMGEHWGKWWFLMYANMLVVVQATYLFIIFISLSLSVYLLIILILFCKNGNNLNIRLRGDPYTQQVFLP